MSQIFIPEIDFSNFSKSEIFVLCRPFLGDDSWVNNADLKRRWGLRDAVCYTSDFSKANIVLIPIAVNYYFKNGNSVFLNEINEWCKSRNIIAYGFISGDFGISYPDFSNINYFRAGGFKKQLSQKNIGFPVFLSDHFKRIYKFQDPTPNMKPEKPIVSFCGYAVGSIVKKYQDYLNVIFLNFKRFLENPKRKDYEPIFASSYERWELLKRLELDAGIECRFVFRNKYRGGAKTTEERNTTTLEYYDNMLHSDYVLCLRGRGNFSVRFYEALMMGKIPILMNTDCLLPLQKQIDWKKHVVWVEWEDRYELPLILKKFHDSMSTNEFTNLQLKNRELWKNQITVGAVIESVLYDF